MLTLAWCAVLAAAPASSRLPLKSLVLYENGLGYFERRGPVAPGGTVEIPLEAGQLDDALKSMVMMSERSVASVEYAPPLSEEAARALAGLPNDGEPRSLEGLLGSMAGVDVKATTLKGAVSRGRVMEVVNETEHDKDGNELPAPTLVLFGEAGLSRVRVRELASVRPVDPAVQQAWDRATGASSGQPDRQALKLRGGTQGGTVAVGYTTEAPVWRTTYRLVMGPRPTRLQGFALVHNDSDEAWDGVKVTLASGKPTSFLFPLAGPRYSRREMVSPEDGLDAAPQLSSAEAREHLRGSAGGVIGLGSFGTVGHGSGGGGYGSGVGVLGDGHASDRGESISVNSDLLIDGPSALEPAAVSEAGELFLYTVKEPVFLGARRSALLPIVDSPVAGEAVTVIDESGHTALAVRLANSTGLTLEGGTLSVFADGAYAGESQVDRVKPGEVRVVRHGEDLDVQVSRTQLSEAGPVQAVRRNDAGQVEFHRVDRQRSRLELNSRTAKKRTLLLALPAHGYRVVSGAEEDVRSPGEPRYARFALGPKEKKSLDVVEEGAFVTRLTIEQVGTAQLDLMLRDQVPQEVRAALLALRSDVVQAEAALATVSTADAKARALEADLTRVRENLAATGKGGATKAAEQLGQQLLKLEGELKALRAERDAAIERSTQARKAALAGLPLRSVGPKVGLR